MATNGQWLFRRNHKLTEYLEELGPTVYQSIGLILGEDRDASELRDRLNGRYLLRPLHVGAHLWTQVSTGRERHTVDGEERMRSAVLGYVPYQGSSILWDVCPQPSFRFPLRARVGKKGIKLCGFVDGRDVAPFEARVAAELPAMYEALHLSWPTIGSYNDRIRAEIDRQIRTY